MKHAGKTTGGSGDSGDTGDTGDKDNEPIRLSLFESTLNDGLAQSLGKEYIPNINLRSETTESVVSARIEKLGEAGTAHKRYVLKGEIGRGGMGAVLKIFDSDLRRNLAMKIVLGSDGKQVKNTTGAGAQQVMRFIEEAQVTGQLDHPGIVPVHDLGIDADGCVYFTMRLVKGVDLSSVFEDLHSGAAEWNQTRALGVLLKVCDAMSYAHEKGVVHRDLKPANIMVGRHGAVYVMDWGLARVEGHAESHDVRLDAQLALLSEFETDRHDVALQNDDSPLMTRDGAVLGTPFYMPPEQAAGRLEEIGACSDVYAVGAMLYHLITGRIPYYVAGDRVTAQTILARVLQGPPESIHALAPRTAPELAAICEKAMARRSSDRYANMGEFADDLRAYLENRVVHAHRTGAWIEFKKWTQRNRGLAASLAAAVMLAIFGAGSVAYVQAKGKDLALEQQKIAEANARVANLRSEDVLRLSLGKDYVNLLAEADELWPVRPDKIDEFKSWIERANGLVATLPSLIDKRDELRAHALELTQDQQDQDQASNPDRVTLDRLQLKINSGLNALAVRRGQAMPRPVQVDWSEYLEDPTSLAEMAWRMVNPKRDQFGEEALGLALALRAVELSSEAEWAANMDIVAWGYFASGQDQAALDAAVSALEDAPPAERERAGNVLEELEHATSLASSTEAMDEMRAHLDQLELQAAELKSRLEERRTWIFPEENDGENKTGWWHEELSGLVANLESLTTPGTGLLTPDGISVDHGWSVMKRLTQAEALRDGFEAGGEYARRWEQALPGIRATYPGMQLNPQMGLVPLGLNTSSRLWEFWDILSGAEPQSTADGKLKMEEDSGLVFVLLEGGKFWMGAQSTDPNARNFDRSAAKVEGPVHAVELSAFFMSKYEMNQGQWKRLANTNPSKYGPDGEWKQRWSREGVDADLLLPVTNVSWEECHDLLEHFGLDLPSEAQWEYGSRGGTSTVFWSGNSPRDLEGAANVLDSYALSHGVENWVGAEKWLDDGYTLLAPVDAFRANSFGLHQVCGNVQEWCLDGYDSAFYGRRARPNAVSPPVQAAACVTRGGTYAGPALNARSAERNSYPKGGSLNLLGLRPVRPIVP